MLSGAKMAAVPIILGGARAAVPCGLAALLWGAM